MAQEAVDLNAAQRRYWNTVAGPRWVASPGFREQRNQESLALLLARLGLIGDESGLEIGCGTGALTIPLAEAVGEHGRVVAVDISEPMLGAARQRIAERGLHNVTLHSADAQVFAFEPAAFDLATSRMGVMFFADPAEAFRNIKGALKPGARLVFACWAPLAEIPDCAAEGLDCAGAGLCREDHHHGHGYSVDKGRSERECWRASVYARVAQWDA